MLSGGENAVCSVASPPVERRLEVVWDVPARRPLAVGAQSRPVCGVGTPLDEQVGTLSRREAPEVGETVFGHDDVDVVFGVVDVADERDDPRYLAIVRRRRKRNDREVGRPQEVAPPTDPADDPGPADVGGVGVAVDVDRERAVDRDDAEPVDPPLTTASARLRSDWARTSGTAFG